MTQADKRLIEADPDAALQDKLLLRRIAGPAKLSISEVRAAGLDHRAPMHIVRFMT